MDSPKTLLEAVQYFSDPENCRRFMIAVRWSDGIVKCPHCGSEKVSYLEKARVYQCYGKHPKSKFSLKVGTVFEDSPIRSEERRVGKRGESGGRACGEKNKDA